MSEDPTPHQDRDRERVAAALEQIRAGVRQRRAELATLGERDEERKLVLLELKSREFVEEPTPVSPRPVIGRLLVFVRKAFFHLLMKWYLRPVLQQHNAFNQTASRLLQETSVALEDLSRQVERLARRVEALEAAGDDEDAPGDTEA